MTAPLASRYRPGVIPPTLMPHVHALIDWAAAQALLALERDIDVELLAIGVPQSTVNRRRGQIRRHQANKLGEAA